MSRKISSIGPECNSGKRQLPRVNWGRRLIVAGCASALIAGSFLLGYASSESRKVRCVSAPPAPCICTCEETPAAQKKLLDDVRKLRKLHKTVERARLELEILSADIGKKLDALEWGKLSLTWKREGLGQND